MSCVEEVAVAPSHEQLRRQELEDGRKVPGWEKDDTTPSSNPGRSLKTMATLPAGTSANSRRPLDGNQLDDDDIKDSELLATS